MACVLFARQSIGELGKPQTDKARNICSVNTDVWQLVYDVNRASSRSSSRHIVAVQHTGVKSCLCAVGSMPNGCHEYMSVMTEKFQFPRWVTSVVVLYVFTSMCKLVKCECDISNYGWWQQSLHPSNDIRRTLKLQQHSLLVHNALQ